MSSDELRPVSYVVLALVGRGGASAHDLVRMVDQGREVYFSVAASHLYAEPKRLAGSGHLSARRAPGRTRERTVYSLTPKGEAVLRAWIASPSAAPRVNNEAHVRLLAGDLVDDATIVASFRAMLPELDRLESLVNEMDAHAGELPHRARYLRLNHRWARRLLALHREWVAEVEAELGDAPRRGTGRS